MTQLRRIAFRVDPGESPDWPSVTVLVDGDDVIGRVTGFRGFDPGEIFGPEAPLLPRDPPRRVAIYRCSCGEPGCGCAAGVISETRAVVHWRDFRDFVGVYAQPTVDTDPDPADGAGHDLPELAFDSVQYRAEVERAGADRSWETRRRRLARLLRRRLVEAEGSLRALGYRLGWASPAWDRDEGIDVELRAPNGQVVIAIDADLRLTDDEIVDLMVAGIIDRPEDDWHVLHRNLRPQG